MPLLTASPAGCPPQHVPRRILRRIDHRIARRIAAVAASEPGLLERVAGQARQLAVEALGLAEIHAELEAVAAERTRLDERQRQAQRAMLAVVRRTPLEEVPQGGTLRMHPEVVRAIARAQAAQEEHLLGQHPAGREILRLRREREHLLEALWLAGAPQPLKELWRRLLELVGEEPTALEKEALPREAPAGGEAPS